MTSRNREGGLGCGYLAYATIAGALLGVVADFGFNSRGATGAVGGFLGGAVISTFLN